MATVTKDQWNQTEDKTIAIRDGMGLVTLRREGERFIVRRTEDGFVEPTILADFSAELVEWLARFLAAQ